MTRSSTQDEGLPVLVLPSLSFVEQKSQQADGQSDQQDSQHHPQRLAPPQQRQGPVVLLLPLIFHSPEGSGGGGEVTLHSPFRKFTVKTQGFLT